MEGYIMLEFLKIMLDGKNPAMDERGATAVEYGLLVALIAAVIVTVVVTLGPKVKAGFDTVNSAI